ncbi:hypothetical protein GQ53DRAFT_80512 [Thozetella sp. PMI_491]|nr:hypothetical protein GQ53DRAFT_80512 [Thozetella sp. PMI_491]
MSSRYAAARPKRASEAFARAHHGEDSTPGPQSSKKVKFDVRNPSALAPTQDVDDIDDEVLAADVIGGAGRATKRGAVNIDGYDSDSDNENFNARAEARGAKGGGDDVDFSEVMDNYDKNKNGSKPGAEDDEEEMDMFGGGSDDDEDASKKKAKGLGKKDKSVRFLADDDIQGQEEMSRSGGTVRIDTDAPDTEEEDSEEEELAREEEDIDEEVGAGGSKRHAPKIDAFNMRQEQEEGAFDEAGNYIRKAVDADALHDRWLEGVSKKEMRKAAEMQEKRDAITREKQKEEDKILTAELLRDLIQNLELGETALEALARLGKGVSKPKKAKVVPKWKQKKKQQADGDGDAMDVEKDKEAEDPKQTKLKAAINKVTDAADKLLKRNYPDIYDTERELLMREYRNETGEQWVDPPRVEEEEADDESKAARMWEYRWTDGRDDAIQGPFDAPTMAAWQNAGYFGEGVEFRPAGKEDGWTRLPDFV